MTSRWGTLLTSARLRPSRAPAPGDEGNEFLSDYYRVVFSSSFRRLQDKTQVSPLAETDYVRRRLTHSVEVAVVGERMGRVVARRLAGRIGQNDARDAFGKIIATACLLHDIGNPPFGHEGELAIRAWADTNAAKCTDFRCFDGNAQGFRIAVRLQHHGKPFGMNMTAATLATMLKYPKAPSGLISEGQALDDRGKFSVFSSEDPHYRKVAEMVGLELGRRHPLSYLVEAADDIVNRLVDIEDALKLRLVAFSEVLDTLKAVDSATAEELARGLEERLADITTGDESERQLWAYQNFRVRATTKLAEACEEVFTANIEELENGTFDGELVEECEHSKLYKALKKLEYRKIFGDSDIVRREAGGKAAIIGLLNILRPEVANGSKLAKTVPMYMASDIDPTSDEHSDDRRVVDYVAGMTDRYAVDLYQELSGISL